MRLIDADALKKNLAEWLIGGDPQETIMVKLDDVLVSVAMEIDKQPIAYDVEKVVEELEKLSNAEADYYYAKSNDVIDRETAIEIVRKGGV